jgi:hypothetical protein
MAQSVCLVAGLLYSVSSPLTWAVGIWILQSDCDGSHLNNGTSVLKLGLRRAGNHIFVIVTGQFYALEFLSCRVLDCTLEVG